MVRIVFFPCQRLFGGGRNYLRRKLRGNQEMAPKKRTLASATPRPLKPRRGKQKMAKTNAAPKKMGPATQNLWTWGRFSSPTVLTTKQGTNGWLKRKITNGGKRYPKKIILVWADYVLRENAPPHTLIGPRLRRICTVWSEISVGRGR